MVEHNLRKLGATVSVDHPKGLPVSLLLVSRGSAHVESGGVGNSSWFLTFNGSQRHTNMLPRRWYSYLAVPRYEGYKYARKNILPNSNCGMFVKQSKIHSGLLVIQGITVRDNRGQTKTRKIMLSQALIQIIQ